MRPNHSLSSARRSRQTPDRSPRSSPYVATSVATFEEVAPTAADWRQRLGELAARNLPFLVAEAAAAGAG